MKVFNFNSDRRWVTVPEIPSILSRSLQATRISINIVANDRKIAVCVSANTPYARTQVNDDAEATHVSSRVCAFMQFVTRGTGIPPLK